MIVGADRLMRPGSGFLDVWIGAAEGRHAEQQGALPGDFVGKRTLRCVHVIGGARLQCNTAVGGQMIVGADRFGICAQAAGSLTSGFKLQKRDMQNSKVRCPAVMEDQR